MFRQELENDLKAIFEQTRVKFKPVEEGLEQDVLYVQIDKVKEIPRNDNFYFAVSGAVGTHSLSTINRWGFLLERARLSGYENKDRFRFASNERSVQGSLANDDFIKTKLDFSYRIKIPFNPTVGNITNEKLNWVQTIIKYMKG